MRRPRPTVNACMIIYVLAWLAAGSLVAAVVAGSYSRPEPSPRWEIVTPHGNIENGSESWSRMSVWTAEPTSWPTPTGSLAPSGLPTSLSILAHRGARPMHVLSGRHSVPVSATEQPSAGTGSLRRIGTLTSLPTAPVASCVDTSPVARDDIMIMIITAERSGGCSAPTATDTSAS